MEGGDSEFPHLNIQSDISLQEPDLDQLMHDRMERNKAVMKVGRNFGVIKIYHYGGRGCWIPTSEHTE